MSWSAKVQAALHTNLNPWGSGPCVGGPTQNTSVQGAVAGPGKISTGGNSSGFRNKSGIIIGSAGPDTTNSYSRSASKAGESGTSSTVTNHQFENSEGKYNTTTKSRERSDLSPSGGPGPGGGPGPNSATKFNRNRGTPEATSNSNSGNSLTNNHNDKETSRLVPGSALNNNNNSNYINQANLENLESRANSHVNPPLMGDKGFSLSRANSDVNPPLMGDRGYSGSKANSDVNPPLMGDNYTDRLKSDFTTNLKNLKSSTKSRHTTIAHGLTGHATFNMKQNFNQAQVQQELEDSVDDRSYPTIVTPGPNNNYFSNSNPVSKSNQQQPREISSPLSLEKNHCQQREIDPDSGGPSGTNEYYRSPNDHLHARDNDTSYVSPSDHHLGGNLSENLNIGSNSKTNTRLSNSKSRFEDAARGGLFQFYSDRSSPHFGFGASPSPDIGCNRAVASPSPELFTAVNHCSTTNDGQQNLITAQARNFTSSVMAPFEPYDTQIDLESKV